MIRKKNIFDNGTKVIYENRKGLFQQWYEGYLPTKEDLLTYSLMKQEWFIGELKYLLNLIQNIFCLVIS